MKKKLQIISHPVRIFLQWTGVSALLYLVAQGMPQAFSGNAFTRLFYLLLLLFFGSRQVRNFLLSEGYDIKDRHGFICTCLLLSILLTAFFYTAARLGWLPLPFLFILNTANLFTAASLAGLWIIKPLKRSTELVILCLVLALSDLFSVLGGPSRQIVDAVKTYYEGGMTGSPPLGDFLLIKFPVPGAGHLMPVFGVSDWIVVVFLSAAARKLAIDDNVAGKSLHAMDAGKRAQSYFPAAAAGLLLAVWTANILNRFIPALPIVSLVFVGWLLLFHPPARDFRRKEWALLAWAAGLLLTILAVGLLWWNR
jgi:hypothetical protein